MNLYVDCKSCGEPMLIKENALTRSELEDKIGSYFKMKCEHCGATNEYHVNDVYATGGDLIKKLGTYLSLVLVAFVILFARDNQPLVLLGLFTSGVIFFASRRTATTNETDMFNNIEVRMKTKTNNDE